MFIWKAIVFLLHRIKYINACKGVKCVTEVYKQRIKELLDKITDEKVLRYLYILAQEFADEE